MRYAELHCKTNFSFLVGASHADELAARAAQLGYAGLAVTDQNSLAGVVKAHVAAKEYGLPLVVGSELILRDGTTLVVWVTNRIAYGGLARMITVGRRRAAKGQCDLTLTDVAAHATDLLAAVVPHRFAVGGEGSGRQPTPASLPSDVTVLDATVGACREIFSDRLYLLAELHRGVDDDERAAYLAGFSARHKIPLLAAGDVHYHVPGRMVLHDLVTAIRWGTNVDLAQEALFANAQRHLRSLNDIEHVYRCLPGAAERTVEVVQRCGFSLDSLRYEYPEELAPDGQTPYQYLSELTWAGAASRYPRGVPAKVTALLRHELDLIQQLQYEAYFLTVWDLVQFARSRHILCQGRGSAANSAVCFCLGITSVDPDRTDTLFERFISKERDEAPDIDVDFEHERREEVLQYLYDKYGRERAGIAAEVITYRVRSAVRDVGKALGLSLDRVDALAKQVEGYTGEDCLADRCRQVGMDPRSPLTRRLIYGVEALIGFPRHLSQHVGGMVITRGPLCELVPIENAAMEGRTVISWDKNDLEELGILKIDCLALGMLTAIRKCFDLIRASSGQEWSLATIPAEDPDVYRMICQADTMGVFQIESRAQMSMLPRLRPRCYYDLVVEVAIVRPGPIQGQMVHPYLRRRMGLEEASYPNEAIRDVLHKTLGVPIFQEQAMRLAVVAAGFSPGEADQLRRAMGAWRRTGVIDQFRRKLLDGMQQRGLSAHFAEQVFRQIRGFGEYGFPESHAASFALLVYVSAWLKHHFPAAFTAALINSQPMGFYAPSQLLRDVRAHGVDVLPIDINYSDWNCRLVVNADTSPAADSSPSAESRWAIRLGLRLIIGLSERHVDQIQAARQAGPFRSMEEVAKRTGLSTAVLQRLSAADVFRSLGQDRRESLWQSLAQTKSSHEMPLLANIADPAEPDVRLPEVDSFDEVCQDYATMGLSLKAHPISFYRLQLSRLEIRTAAELVELPNDAVVAVAGLVILRQRPSTAKGITFVTLEDETGTVNLVVHQRTWERFYSVARRSPTWIARGTLQRKYSVIHVVVQHLEDMATSLRQFKGASRDFR